MNSHSRKLVKPGDVFVHHTTGELYKLLKLTKENHRGQLIDIYHFLDIKTDQLIEYTWGMFRDRLKYAPPQAQILYIDKAGEVKTGRENVN